MGKAEKEGKTMTVKGRSILIVGPNTLQNDLIASFLQKEISANCVVLDPAADLSSHQPGGDEPDVLLYDCMGDDVDAWVERCAPLLERNPCGHYLCLLNLEKGAGAEESLVTRGVRGFFYMGESIQNLAKGVRAVLNGEFWVSRRIMNDLIKKSSRGAKRAHQEILTRREVNILALIAEGATNGEIADKLCISRYTVKTHLYNVFKKLNVKSRFQAALWAAKHL